MSSGLIKIDKPQGWTSHDIVAKLRGIIGTRKIGHTGTLDPMATGLLIICVGKATRAAEHVQAGEKEYEARFRVGEATDTQDATGTIISMSAYTPPRRELEAAIRRYSGAIMQAPPMYSAVKINGVRLYELARRGVEAERKPREIYVRELELTGYDETLRDGSLRIVCSKGTYIRTLIDDIGRAAGAYATMSALRRTRVGSFTLDGALTPDALAAARAANDDGWLIPVSAAFDGMPGVELSAAEGARLKNGAFVSSEPFTGESLVCCGGELLGVYTCRDGVLKARITFYGG